jgi:hypothetical protein
LTFAADHLRLDLSALPSHSAKLQAGFYLGLGNNKKPLLLVAPGSGNSAEPHVRYAAGMVLTLADGTVVKDLGQLVLTSDRIIGMMTQGSAGPVRLDGAAGSVYAFSARMDDLHPAEPRKNRRGGLTGAVLRSRDGQPGFALEVNSVIGSLDDDGLLAFRASLTDLLRSLTPESRSLMNPYPGSL